MASFYLIVLLEIIFIYKYLFIYINTRKEIRTMSVVAVKAKERNSQTEGVHQIVKKRYDEAYK